MDNIINFSNTYQFVFIDQETSHTNLYKLKISNSENQKGSYPHKLGCQKVILKLSSSKNTRPYLKNLFLLKLFLSLLNSRRHT